jgi:hypothetical protein
VKIAGDSLLVAFYTGDSKSITVISWGLILSQLGFYPLVNASLQFVRKWYPPKTLRANNRIDAWRHSDPDITRFYSFIRLIHPILLTAFVLAIISGAWTSPNSGHINTAYNLRRAADILFLFVTSLLMGMVIRMMMKSKSKEQRFDLVLVQVLVVTFILIIRMIYATAQAFISNPHHPNPNTWVYLGLLMIPDCLAVSIYTICGLVLKASPPAQVGFFADDSQAPSQIPQPNQKPEDGSQPAVSQPTRRRQRRLRGPIGMLIAAIRENA